MSTATNRDILILEPRLFPSVDWYSTARHQSMACLNVSRGWNKREKSTHRYTIADVRGPLQLTVPIEKPESITRATFADIKLSDHGKWWHVHKVTLESAYGRTPFFEHYFPKLEEFFSAEVTLKYEYLWEYLLATTSRLGQLLQIETRFAAVADNHSREEKVQPVISKPYWQVRASSFGFLQGLSALDLLFNLGPEAALYMRSIR